MKHTLPKVLLFVIVFISNSIILSAQSEYGIEKNYNTKRNFVFINGSLGGGDYPFAGLGITLSRQLFNGETMAGISFQYIGNTATDNTSTRMLILSKSSLSCLICVKNSWNRVTEDFLHL